MNLNDVDQFPLIDKSNMYNEILNLPRQIENAWDLTRDFSINGIRKPNIILIAGMGGSAIGGDLLAGWAEKNCSIPIVVWRNYGLPAWALSKDTLIITSSHSGNTEETLSSFDLAIEKGMDLLAVSTGGEMESRAKKLGVPWLGFKHSGQPRAAVGYSFGIILGMLERLQVIKNPHNELVEATRLLDSQINEIGCDVLVNKNAAKRLAGQMVGRLPVIFGSDHLAAVARRWKGQLNEVAKTWSQFEVLPEADHNTAAGTVQSEEILNRLIAIFLDAEDIHPRNRKRISVTKQGFIEDGINSDTFIAKGKSPMAQLFSALQFGDFVAYYLALTTDVDPTPIDSIMRLKTAMQT